MSSTTPERQPHHISDNEVATQFGALMRHEFPDGLSPTPLAELTPPSAGPSSANAFNILRSHNDEMSELFNATLGREALALTENELLKADNNRLKQEQRTSEVTKIPNRKAFDEWLDKAIERADSSPSEHKPLTVGFLDIDNFKFVNETYKHELADDVIRRIADILKSGVRENDDMIAAHRSGDEFLIGINGAGPERIHTFAQSVLHAVNQIYIRKNADGKSEIIDQSQIDSNSTADNLHQISISMGFAHRSDNMSVTDLMTAADSAMYEAKNSGRNRIVIDENPA